MTNMENRSQSYQTLVAEFGSDWARVITTFAPIFKEIDRVASPEFYNYGFGGDTENVYSETIQEAEEWAKQTKKLFLSYGEKRATEIVAQGNRSIYCGDGWWMPVDFELAKALAKR